MMKPESTAADRETLFARLKELCIASVTAEHEAVFTVEQSQSLRDRLPGAHTKNPFVVDRDGRAALVVAKDDTSVDLKLVAKRLGLGRLSFAKPERLLDLLGVTPGLGHALRPDQRSRGARYRGRRCGPPRLPRGQLSSA